MAITSYAQLQAFLNSVLTTNQELSDTQNGSPHRDWWNSTSYEDFIGGNVPGVPGAPVPTLVVGHSAQSNLVLVLQDSIRADIPRMPADGGPFFTADQIKQIADWIDAGCPR